MKTRVIEATRNTSAGAIRVVCCTFSPGELLVYAEPGAVEEISALLKDLGLKTELVRQSICG